jgi:hypothetical protein
MKKDRSARARLARPLRRRSGGCFRHQAVLNFSPGTLQVPDDVKLKSVDLTVSLESLSFYLARGEEGR